MLADRWGVTDEEVARHYPADEVMPGAGTQVWRGVTVHATPDAVWPWIAQIRLAPYSYDWIDNLCRRSPQEVRGLPDPVPGEAFTTAAGRRMGRIVSSRPGEELTGRLAGVVISYVLVPAGSDTRLLMKINGRFLPVLAPVLAFGDLVMARRQLLNLKRLAERGTRPPVIS